MVAKLCKNLTEFVYYMTLISCDDIMLDQHARDEINKKKIMIVIFVACGAKTKRVKMVPNIMGLSSGAEANVRNPRNN